jgi:hypothetical protein
LLKSLFISALYSWWRWRFSPGRFFARSTAGGIRTIIVQSRRQNTSGCPSIAHAIQHWRKPAACRHFAPKNSLHPRPDLKRMIDGTKPENKPKPVGYRKANQRRV